MAGMRSLSLKMRMVRVLCWIIGVLAFPAMALAEDDPRVDARLQNFQKNVVVPEGGRIVLRFGRHRAAVVLSWLASLLLLAGAPLLERVEKRDGRASEVERAGNDDRPLGSFERET